MCSLGGVCCSERSWLRPLAQERVCVTGETEGLRERLLSPGSQGGRSRGPGDRDKEAEGWPLIPQGGMSAVQPAVPGMAQTRGSPLPTVHQAWGGRDAACKAPAASTHRTGVGHTPECEDEVSAAWLPAPAGQAPGRRRFPRGAQPLCCWRTGLHSARFLAGWEAGGEEPVQMVGALRLRAALQGAARTRCRENSRGRTRASPCRQDPAKARALGRGGQGAGGAGRQAERVQVARSASEEDQRLGASEGREQRGSQALGRGCGWWWGPLASPLCESRVMGPRGGPAVGVPADDQGKVPAASPPAEMTPQEVPAATCSCQGLSGCQTPRQELQGRTPSGPWRACC